MRHCIHYILNLVFDQAGHSTSYLVAICTGNLVGGFVGYSKDSRKCTVSLAKGCVMFDNAHDVKSM